MLNEPALTAVSTMSGLPECEARAAGEDEPQVDVPEAAYPPDEQFPASVVEARPAVVAKASAVAAILIR